MKDCKLGALGLCCWLAVLSLSLSAAELQELDGIIEPHATVELSFPVEGVVEVIHPDRSDPVEAGQEVARLESSVEQAAVYQAKAQAHRSGEVLAKQTSLKFARSKLARINELFVSKAVSSHEKEEAETQVALARMELKQAQETKEVAEQNLKRTQAVLERRRIMSPVSGVVVERFISPGEFVKENPVLKIAQLDPLRVEVIAPASMFGKIKRDMAAEVEPESPVMGTYAARVTVVDQIIDAASGTFGVRLELPNPDHQLPGGLRCRVKFLPGTERQLSRGSSTGPTPGNVPDTKAATAGSGETEKSKGAPFDATVEAESPAPPHPPMGARITRSVKAPPSAGAVATGVGLKQPAVENCALLGPFRFVRRLDQVGAELEGEYANLTMRKRRKVETHGYSLLAPPHVTGAEQQRFIARLKAQGITDFLALAKGRFKGRLALGHFKERRLAEERQLELKQQGFSSDIEPRYRVRRWLELKPGPDFSESLSSLLQQVETNWPDMDLDLVSCAEENAVRPVEKLVSK